MADFGLMFYNARWYDPYLNRWTQPDTIVPDPGNPQDWDRYSYALNNPVRYSDPSGHASCSGSNWDDGPQCFVNGKPKNLRIPDWDPSFSKHVNDADKRAAIKAYVNFLSNPAQFAEYFVNPRNAPAEYDALELFAEYTTLHSSSDQLILGSVASSQGVDAAQRVTNARQHNLEAYGSKSNDILTAAGAMAAMVIPLGRGSTGRTIPLSLEEQLAMEQAMADPLNGAQQLRVNMTDSRWLASDGWEKWANNINGVEIHFNYNPLTNQFDDFKFK